MADARTGNDHKNDYKAECKVWLKKECSVLGEGLFKLLSNVDKLGSISQAARLMGMSYRAAWGKIRLAEERLGMSLVITQVGGETGGGARLTPEAFELLKRFRKLRQEVDNFVSKTFKEIFKGWPGP